MTAAERIDLAEGSVRRALDVTVRTPDDMLTAVARLGDAVIAVHAAHGAIHHEARTLGASERADTAEVDAMLGELMKLWSARFGRAGADVTRDAPALLAVQWDAVDHVDTEIEEIDRRANALLDGWTARADAWTELAELERRARSAMATVVERQRELRARYTAAQEALPTILALEALRDELLDVVRAVADNPRALPAAVIGSARRRCGSAVVEMASLTRAHGAVPGFSERAARLTDTFALLREALTKKRRRER